MQVVTKFDIGEKFVINDEYSHVMGAKKTDLFRVDKIIVSNLGVYYKYHKYPKKDKLNKIYNKRYAGSELAEFAMEKVK
jgi:hypothetical protein